MRAPRFWTNPPDAPGRWARMLRPASSIWLWLAARRWRDATPWRAPVPVICVGNLTAGGTGKTPTVIHIAEILTEAGHSPHIISRGHGGALKGPAQVDLIEHRARHVGDEPLLLALAAPTWVARDRAAGARAAVAAGATVLLLDDGFQNPGLTKDFSILVIDAEAGFGNGLIMPAGPLREPVAEGVARADMLLMMGEGPVEPPPGPPVFHGKLRPRLTTIGIMGTPVIAFAGIGRPEKFFATIRSMGARVLREIPFPDHHRYKAQTLQRLASDAAHLRAQLVTTEKDAARFPRWFHGKAIIVPVVLGLEDEENFASAILNAAGQAGANAS